MAVLLQEAPFTDSIAAGVSEQYSNQLVMTGGSGVITFETTQSSVAVLVFPGGEVTTTGVLTNGNYTVSGTASDQYGNSGTWSFTLTITSNVSPEVSVIPVTPVLPNPIEIAVPFSIDPATGGVAVLTSYVQILEQHLTTIIMTALGERLMMPTYGVGLELQTFTPAVSLESGLLATDIKNMIATWEPAVTVNEVTVDESLTNPNQVTVTVTFSVVPYSSNNTVVVSTGGSITQVSAQ